MSKIAICLLLAAAFTGCATHQNVVVSQPVGPDLVPSRINITSTQGQLVVYTAPEVANTANSDFPTHSAYAIYDGHGTLVRRVSNRSGSFDQCPAAVSLAPGKYTVKAPATNVGMVSVPVIVKVGETTSLDLDTAHFRQKKPTGAGQWVRLPTGEVIGMRAP